MALAAADGPPGVDGLANSLVASDAQVVGEQAGQVEWHLLVVWRGQVVLLDGDDRRRVELVWQFAGTGGVQDAADGPGGDLVLPSQGFDGDAFPVGRHDGDRLVGVQSGRAAEGFAGGVGGGDAFAVFSLIMSRWNSRTAARTETIILVPGSSLARSIPDRSPDSTRRCRPRG